MTICKSGKCEYQQGSAGEHLDSLPGLHHRGIFNCNSIIIITVFTIVSRLFLQQAAAGGEDDQDGLLGLRLRQQGAARHSRDPHRLPQEDRHQVTWRSQLALFFTFTTLEARKIMHPIHFLRNNKRRALRCGGGGARGERAHPEELIRARRSSSTCSRTSTGRRSSTLSSLFPTRPCCCRQLGLLSRVSVIIFYESLKRHSEKD